MNGGVARSDSSDRPRALSNGGMTGDAATSFTDQGDGTLIGVVQRRQAVESIARAHHGCAVKQMRAVAFQGVWLAMMS